MTGDGYAVVRLGPGCPQRWAGSWAHSPRPCWSTGRWTANDLYTHGRGVPPPAVASTLAEGAGTPVLALRHATGGAMKAALAFGVFCTALLATVGVLIVARATVAVLEKVFG